MRIFFVLSALTVALAIVLFLSGCSTVSPDLVLSPEPGYVDNVRDSGVKEVVQGVHSCARSRRLTISESDRLEYNQLIARFGTSPILTGAPLKANAGLVRFQDRWAIDNDHFVDFGLLRDMARQQGSALPPK